MSLSSDNFTALIHLRDQARKWKNITFITAIILIVIMVKVISSDSKEDNNLTANDNFIASIDIDGIILSNKHRSKILQEISQKDNIKAVIVNINSPGGGIVGSEMLYNDIKNIAKKKPVIASLGSVAASGGYMAALGANHILAYNGTLTGSIGVIIQSSEVTKMADNLGIKFKNYKSSHLKATPSLVEKTDPIIDKAINESIQDSYKFFVNLVLTNRKTKIDKNNIDLVTDGRVFTGNQALELGLVDAIGGRDQALEYLKKHHKLANLEVKEISLRKLERKWIDKLIGEDSMSNLLSSNFHGKKIMAVW
jgi:protease-4